MSFFSGHGIQRLQYWGQDCNMANKVRFSNNQIADILYQQQLEKSW